MDDYTIAWINNSRSILISVLLIHKNNEVKKKIKHCQKSWKVWIPSSKGSEGPDMISAEISEIRKNNLISLKMKKTINIIYVYSVGLLPWG